MKVEIKTIEQLRRYKNIKTTTLGRVWRQSYTNILKGKNKLTEYISVELQRVFDISKEQLEILIANEIELQKSEK